MKNKLLNWAILLITFIIVAWLLFNIDLWAGDWKSLFFYQDNWIMYVYLAIMVTIIGAIIKKIFVIEVKALK